MKTVRLNVLFTDIDDINVNIQDEGQTGIKEVTGPIPMEEKIYAVRYTWEISNKLLLGVPGCWASRVIVRL